MQAYNTVNSLTETDGWQHTAALSVQLTNTSELAYSQEPTKNARAALLALSTKTTPNPPPTPCVNSAHSCHAAD
jgi:hypothetical protein